MPFADRKEAGRRLGGALRTLLGAPRHDVVVLGLPRGGLAVAEPVAEVLGAPLDVLVVRKLGAPFQPELALGAVGEGGIRVLNTEVLERLGVEPATLDALEQRELAEVRRRADAYRAGRPRLSLAGRTTVLVDDGLATGSTCAVACQAARAEGATQVVVAAPVGPPSAVAALRQVADEVVVLETPVDFVAVGQWYRRFEQTSESEVTAILARARSASGAPG